MRRRGFAVGSFVHIFNRGNRKQPIVREVHDKWRFLQMLYYFNTSIHIANPFRKPQGDSGFSLPAELIWPKEWPLQKPIVKVIAFVLADNHFHLILKEIIKGGIALFMQKMGVGMTLHFNNKYQETGRLFQGPYQANVADSDLYLKYLTVYIQVKNVFELHPKGLKNCLANFDKAFNWAVQYPYCSLSEYVDKRKLPIVDKDILGRMFTTPEKYKIFVKDSLFAIDFKKTMEVNYLQTSVEI
jgi:hypothetical protein